MKHTHENLSKFQGTKSCISDFSISFIFYFVQVQRQYICKQTLVTNVLVLLPLTTEANAARTVTRRPPCSTTPMGSGCFRATAERERLRPPNAVTPTRSLRSRRLPKLRGDDRKHWCDHCKDHLDAAASRESRGSRLHRQCCLRKAREDRKDQHAWKQCAGQRFHGEACRMFCPW